MQLTHHTDFSLRVLIFLSLQDKEKLVTIDDIACHFNILKNHLSKVVHHLAQHDFIKTVRGKNGGICLLRHPQSMLLGDIIQAMENKTEIVDCEKPACPLLHKCELKEVLNEAKHAFFSTLNKYSLADITSKPEQIKTLLNFNSL